MLLAAKVPSPRFDLADVALVRSERLLAFSREAPSVVEAAAALEAAEVALVAALVAEVDAELAEEAAAAAEAAAAVASVVDTEMICHAVPFHRHDLTPKLYSWFRVGDEGKFI